MMANEEIDYKLAAEQLRTGKPLFGKDGALAPMLERIPRYCRTTLHRTSNTQLYQVCGKQTSERVYEGPETRIWRCQ